MKRYFLQPAWYNKIFCFRDEAICSHLAGARLASNSKVLDVGAGDGRLTQYLAQHLSVQIDALEPDHVLYKKLRKRQIPVIAHHATAQTFFDKNKNFLRYNAIICSHILYHIPPQNWLDLLNGLMGMLKDGGFIVFYIISSNSPIFHLFTEITKYTEKRYRLSGKHGGFVYGEDFCEMLQKEKIPYCEESIRWKIPSGLTCMTGSFYMDYLSFIFKLSPLEIISLESTNHLQTSVGVLRDEIDKGLSALDVAVRILL